MKGTADDEALEDAWIDWDFTPPYIPSQLEKQGFKWFYIGQDLPDEIDTDRRYTIVRDSFPFGDVLAVDKLLPFRLAAELDLAPVDLSTKQAVAQARIEAFYAERPGQPIEVYNPGNKWAAVVHPATRTSAVWQGSEFDKNGPFSHVEGKTVQEVIEKLVKDGYTVPEPGALDRILGDDPEVWWVPGVDKGET